MNPVLRDEFIAKRERLVSLCTQHGVSALDLFGSGVSDAWRPDDSDLDFVVTFDASSTIGLADRYLGLAEGLEALFGRPVDLITPAAMRNPYFRARVEATRNRVYAE